MSEKPILAERVFKVIMLGHISVVVAENRAQAKARAVRSAEDAGYGSHWTAPCQIRRYPEADKLIPELRRGAPSVRCWALEYVASLLAESQKAKVAS